MSILEINQAIQTKEFEKAIQLADDLLTELDKNTQKTVSISRGEVLFRRGYAYFRAQQFDNSLKDYNDSIQIAENPNAYSERGVLHFTMGNLEKALEDMNTALELEPENPYRYSSRAYIRARAGMMMLARNDYKKAIELDPDDSVAHNNLGLIEEQMGYKEKAAGYYKKADDLNNVNAEKFNNEKNSEPQSEESSVSERNTENSLETFSQEETYQSALKKMFSSTKAFKDALRKARDVYFG